MLQLSIYTRHIVQYTPADLLVMCPSYINGCPLFVLTVSCFVSGPKAGIFPRWQVPEERLKLLLHCGSFLLLFCFFLILLTTANVVFVFYFKDVTRDNDWTCPKCGNVNFSFRTVCNMRKCNTPKPGAQVIVASLMIFILHLKNNGTACPPLFSYQYSFGCVYIP